MSFIFLSIIFIAHFIGDFVLKSNWEERNKHKDIMALFSHIVGYSISLVTAFFLMLWFGLVLYPAQDLTLVLLTWLIINIITHFIVDYFTSKLNSRLWARGNMHNIFLAVGFDQLLHILILVGSLYFVLSI